MDNADPRQSGARDDQGNAGQDTLRSSQNISTHRAEPVILDATGAVVVHEEEEARIKAAQTNEEIKTGQKNILDRIKAGERWMIFFTAVVALTTVAQVIQSGCNNKSTSKQVDRIIGAADTQASAAQDISEAEENFSDSASWIEQHLDDAANAIQDSVDTADRNTRTTIHNSEKAFKEGQRAWVGVQDAIPRGSFDEKTSWGVTVIFANSGRTPAREVETSAMFITSPVEIDGPKPEQIAQLVFRPAQSIAPQGKYNQNIGGSGAVGEPYSTRQLEGSQVLISQFQLIKDKHLFLYYFGILKYDDGFGHQRQTQFCILLANPETREAGFCDAFNDMN
jgi:hypothetical protein